MHPETERDLRELPRVIADSFGLVSKAGRKELLLTSALQLTIAVGLVVQLFVVKRLFDAVLVAGESDDVGSIVPELAALVGIGMLLSLAQAVLAEQNRVLAELVGRRAFDGVLNVATRVDLLAFESPDFYDRLIRAVTQGQSGRFRSSRAWWACSVPPSQLSASSSPLRPSSLYYCRWSYSGSCRCGSCPHGTHATSTRFRAR